jgi:hypothetical protein
MTLLPALFASLVLLMAAAKTKRESGHTTKLKQSIFFRYLWMKLSSALRFINMSNFNIQFYCWMWFVREKSCSNCIAFWEIIFSAEYRQKRIYGMDKFQLTGRNLGRVWVNQRIRLPYCSAFCIPFASSQQAGGSGKRKTEDVRR